MAKKGMSRPIGPPNTEEPWVFSYADMMSLLLCFFVIFFSVSDNKGERGEEIKKKLVETFVKDKTTDKTSKSEIGFRNETREVRALQLLVAMLNLEDDTEKLSRKLEETKAATDDLQAAGKALEDELSMPDKAELAELRRRTNKDATVDIILPESTLFAPSSADLAPGADKKLQSLASTLVKVSGLVEIAVSGHTDHTPPSARSYYKDNWSLSAARAGTVARILAENGVPRQMLRAEGVADLRPLFPERDAEGHILTDHISRNRRVEITLRRRSGG